MIWHCTLPPSLLQLLLLLLLTSCHHASSTVTVGIASPMFMMVDETTGTFNIRVEVKEPVPATPFTVALTIQPIDREAVGKQVSSD